jgi:hypothetical protein
MSPAFCSYSNFVLSPLYLFPGIAVIRSLSDCITYGYRGDTVFALSRRW